MTISVMTPVLAIRLCAVVGRRTMPIRSSSPARVRRKRGLTASAVYRLVMKAHRPPGATRVTPHLIAWSCRENLVPGLSTSSGHFTSLKGDVAHETVRSVARDADGGGGLVADTGETRVGDRAGEDLGVRVQQLGDQGRCRVKLDSCDADARRGERGELARAGARLDDRPLVQAQRRQCLVDRADQHRVGVVGVEDGQPG